jgi:prophage maintenance system killer protein
MPEFFQGNLNRDNVIEANKQICHQSKEIYGLDYPEKLDEIIVNIQNMDKIEDAKEQIIRKVSLLLAGLSYAQPFKNGNKRTSLSITILLLRINHFDLPYDTKDKQRDIFKLLESMMYKFEDDITGIVTEIEDFLRERIVKI